LRRLARRHQQLTEEVRDTDRDLAPLVNAAGPRLLALLGVGIDVAGQLLASAGDNPDRLHSEAAFVMVDAGIDFDVLRAEIDAQLTAQSPS